MAYKAVFSDTYLCHYNKNHSKSNGQFVSGDGDGDGISNDHANRSKKSGKVISGWEKDKTKLKKTQQKIIRNAKAERKANWNKKSKTDKALTILGITAGAVSVAGLGAAIYMDHRAEKIRNNEPLFKERVQNGGNVVAKFDNVKISDVVRAVNAKEVGGDW